MLESPDKDFKAANMKMLQWAILNMLETSEKNAKSQQRNKMLQKSFKKREVLKKNQMDIPDLKYTIIELKKTKKQNPKTSMDRLNSRMEVGFLLRNLYKGIHSETLQLNQSEILKKCSGNPDEGRKKETEMKNRTHRKQNVRLKP